jgi:hypothetical protein
VGTLQAEIKSILDNDSVIKTTLGFLVWDYWITPGRPTAAFDPNDGNRLRRNIVILSGGEVDHPSPSRPNFRLWDSFPSIYIYARAHESGKLAAVRAKLRIQELLAPRRINAEEGVNITLRPDDEIALEDSELFPGNIVSIVRWRATGARALAEVS